MNSSAIRLRTFLRTTLTLAAALITSVTWANPPDGVLDQSHASVRAVMAVQAEVTPQVMNWPDVLGTAVSLDDSGNASLVIYVDQAGRGVADVVRALPAQLRGIAVQAELTDKFRAFRGRPGGGSAISHTARQSPPILLGTSGGPKITTTLSLYQFIGYNLLIVAAILVLRVLFTILRSR